MQARCAWIRRYMCPHTTIYVSSYCYVCVLILLYVSSYFYVCVLIQALESWAQAMVLVRAQASARLERVRGRGNEVREEVGREEVAKE